MVSLGRRWRRVRKLRAYVSEKINKSVLVRNMGRLPSKLGVLGVLCFWFPNLKKKN